ncbi:hypothetical protein MHYP_G00051470 [Metynnis hypsauchen]
MRDTTGVRLRRKAESSVCLLKVVIWCSVQRDFTRIRLHVKVRETPTHLWTTDPKTTASEDPPTAAATESERIMMCCTLSR